MPGIAPIALNQGATWVRSMQWQQPRGVNIDLTDWSAAMQIRASYQANDALVTLTSGDGITLGGTDGTIIVLLTAEQTAALPIIDGDTTCCGGEASDGRGTALLGVYDLEMISPQGTVYRLLQGEVTISPQVTRV